MPFRETIADKEFTASARLLSLLELRCLRPLTHIGTSRTVSAVGFRLFF
jgi:hypothetical protein